ncbi:MAG: hypothetical protein HFH14_05725, partial [Lachnospiraceae bacterium]|nr:hypothetical protein [Lachnospiraceae bacterium]
MAQVRQGNGGRPDNGNKKKASNTTNSKSSKSINTKNSNTGNKNTKGRNRPAISGDGHSADGVFDDTHTYAETKRELIIWITLIVSIVLLLCVLNLCGPLNHILGAFLFGMFGILAYVFPFMLFFSTGIFLINRNNKRVVRKVICSWFLYLVLAALVQMLVNDKVSGVFDCYMLGCRTKFGGGFMGGCISLSLSAVMGKLAASIVLIIVCIMLFVFVTGKFIASILVDKSVDRYSEYSAERREIRERQRSADGSGDNGTKRKRSSYFFPRIYNPDKAKDKPQSDESTYTAADNNSDNNMYGSADNNPLDNDGIMNTDDSNSDNNGDTNVHHKNEDNSAAYDIPIYEKELISKFGNNRDSDDSAIEKLLVRAYEDVEINDITEDNEDSIDDISISDMYNSMPYGSDIFENPPKTKSSDDVEWDSVLNNDYGQSESGGENGQLSDDALNEHKENEAGNVWNDYGGLNVTGKSPDYEPDIDNRVNDETGFHDSKAIKSGNSLKEDKEIKSSDATNSDGEVNIEMPPEPIPYIFPSLDLLSKPSKKSRRMTEYELKETARKLQECLKSFKVEVTMKEIICGPTVTRYELQPALGTRVKKITELENDIKLYLAAKDLRIEAPIPGKSAVGIEVPNSENVTITIREMLDTKEFKDHKSNISFAVGKDIGGRNIVADIQKMPHLLIAGSTGSG